MLKGKWIRVTQRDRKKLKDLVKHYKEMSVVADLIGIHENTLKKWLDKDEEASFRSGARERIVSLIEDMNKPQLPVLAGPIAETAFEGVVLREEPHWLTNVVELRDALDTVVRILEGPRA